MGLKRFKGLVYAGGGYVIPYWNMRKEVAAVYEVLMVLPIGIIRWVALGVLALLIVGGVVYFAKFFTFPFGGGRRRRKDD